MVISLCFSLILGVETRSASFSKQLFRICIWMDTDYIELIRKFVPCVCIFYKLIECIKSIWNWRIDNMGSHLYSFKQSYWIFIYHISIAMLQQHWNASWLNLCMFHWYLVSKRDLYHPRNDCSEFAFEWIKLGWQESSCCFVNVSRFMDIGYSTNCLDVISWTDYIQIYL